MGLYSHYSKPELEALRQRLMASLHARLTVPTWATSNGTALTPVFVPDAERLQLAFALSAKVANQASRTVFDAVMAGDDQRKHAARPVQAFSFSGSSPSMHIRVVQDVIRPFFIETKI